MISFTDMLLRLCLALLLGAIIGIERQNHAQPAGLRTNALVALGTCLFMLISAYGFEAFLSIPHMQVDPSRIASYVVAGIGFLGAGTIFRSQGGEHVKGLTTAAAIWVVAAIGLACGIGLLLEAVVTTILTLSILIFLRFAEGLFWKKSFSPLQHIRIEVTAITGKVVEEIYATFTRLKVPIKKIVLHTEKEIAVIQVSCLIQEKLVVGQTIGALQALAGVVAVNADLHTDEGAKALSAHLDEEAAASL